MFRWRHRYASLALTALLLSACSESPSEKSDSVTPATAASVPLEYVGSAACAGCHAAQHDAWQGSHHARAMRLPDVANVSGDFDDVTVQLEDSPTRFRRSEDGYIVDTVDRDGNLRSFPVRYVFGADPLEQYVLDYPGGRGQIPTIAWDVAGARWFTIHPGESIDHTDALHWTGQLQNWNSQCAECHSTALVKGYVAATDTYATTFKEISVGCEACHGRGSRHVDWAQHADDSIANKALELDLRASDGLWQRADGARVAHRSPPLAGHSQIDACGRCHARRTSQTDDYRYGRPLLDTHRPALLSQPLYWPDGQIRDEVFEWGSYLQSKMFAAGVACSNCHDPHSGALKAEGNALCSQCHDPAVFAVPAHHQHAASVACVDCHMPAKTYMAIDPRRDHSFGIPRPDLTAHLGVPNACSACHLDSTTEELSAAVANWYPGGRHTRPHFADAFGSSDVQGLMDVATDSTKPAIVRASAWAALQGRLSTRAQIDALIAATRDRDALVRFGALQAVAMLPQEQAAPIAAPLLIDGVKNNRIEAARIISASDGDLPEALRAPLQRAIVELIAAETYNGDREFGNLNLGNFYAQRGDLAQAERAYTAGLKVAPDSIALRVNLADLFRYRGDDERALSILRDALAHGDNEAAVYEALALTQVRLGRYTEALATLNAGLARMPDELRFEYLRVLTIDGTGDRPRAEQEAARLRKANPDSDLIQSLQFD